LPVKSQIYLTQNTKLDSLTLDRVIENLENSKNTNISINQFLVELEIINQILVQASVFLEAFLESESMSSIGFDIFEDDELLVNAIISSCCEEEIDADDENEDCLVK
jgi:hypothetical protein